MALGALLCLLLAAPSAAAQEQPATVRSDPAVVELAPGQTVTVNVMLTEAREAYGIDVRAAFDPDLVEVVDADATREGVQLTPGSFPQPDFLARNEADNQAGTLRYAITQVNPTEPASGAGVIFAVQLRARSDRGEGAFAITMVELSDRDGILLPVQLENTLVRVASSDPGLLPTAPTVTPTPPTAPTDPPSATPQPSVAPAQPASNPASPTPVTITSVAQATAPSAGPTPAVTEQPAVPTQDTPAPRPTASSTTGADTARPVEAPSATPQALAAAPAAESAAPDARVEAPVPAAPAAAQPDIVQVPPQRLSESQPDSAQPPASDFNRLLIMGIGACVAAAALGLVLIIVRRR